MTPTLGPTLPPAIAAESEIRRLGGEIASFLAARPAEERARLLASVVAAAGAELEAFDRPAPPVGKTDDLAQQIVELEARSPPPDPKVILADARWLQERWGSAELAPYRGTHVAVLNGAVVGKGSDSLQLQLDLARKLNVHPQRLVIEYIW